MAQPQSLGTLYDNNETTIGIPLKLPNVGKYLIKIRQEDGSRTQETVTISEPNTTFLLKNYNGHKKLGYGTNIISVFFNGSERTEIAGYNRWALRLKEAKEAVGGDSNTFLFENLRNEFLIGERNGSNQVFQVSEVPKREFFKLWWNGQFMTILDEANFILNENTKTVTLGFQPEANCVMVVEYFKQN